MTTSPTPPDRQTEPQTLIFDADDTLWENNALFERAVEDFLDWVAHPTLERVALRRIFDDIEAANVAAHGYGSTVFLRSLGDCFARLQQRPNSEAEQAEIAALAAAVVEHRIELLPGVADTLTELGRRHELRLLTKGDPPEQQAKIDASGLAQHFTSLHVVTEKTDAVYRDLAVDLGLDVSRTWMIGNSPKSDILPARRAGMRAVFIPDPNPWFLERADLDEHDAGVLRLASLTELTRHF